jgi:SAM-dependent methyltransferase
MPHPSNIAVLGSPRISFQWKYVWWYLNALGWKDGETPIVLNVGCSDDPVGFGEAAMHFDLDDWSAYHQYFTRGDAAATGFADNAWHVVVVADVLEHVPEPFEVLQEAIRICKPGGFIILTIFEEWRLPGHGQWIEQGQIDGDASSRAQGYVDRADFQHQHFPKMVLEDDVAKPHLCHINQFNDEDIKILGDFMVSRGCLYVSASKDLEAHHEDHDVFNWLLCMQKRRI